MPKNFRLRRGPKIRRLPNPVSGTSQDLLRRGGKSSWNWIDVTQILMICDSATKKKEKRYFQFDRSRRSEGVGSSYLDMLSMLFKILIYFGKNVFPENFSSRKFIFGKSIFF